MLKKLLAALGTLALVLGLVALVAGPASAHNHTVTASCAAGVSVDLTNYATKSTDATPNHVTVWIDDQSTPVTDLAFGGSFSKTYPFSTGKASHSYRVLVYAYDNNASYGFDTGVVTLTGCETAITPAAAAAVPAVCTAAGTVGGGGYTIPVDQTGVTYQLLNPATDTFSDIAAGTYPATPGSTITIQAVPTAGYKLTGTTTWTLLITGPDASSCVVPTPLTPSYSQCTATPGSSSTASYSIPAIATGYRYYLQGSDTPLAPGSTIVSTFPTTVVIVAKTADGYHFPSTATVTWTFTFQSPGNCYQQVTPAAPTPQYTSCTAAPGQSTDNGYTIPTTTGVTYQLKNGDTWVDLTAQFYDLGKATGSVEIRAIANGPYTVTGTSDWTYTFAAASSCLQTVVPKAESTPAVCDTDHPGQQLEGTYTLEDITGVLYSVKVDDGAYAPQAPGTYSVPAGSEVWVLATGDTANGYRVDGAPSWHFTFPSASDCTVPTALADPTFIDGVCDADHPGHSILGNYELTQGTHATFTAAVNGGAPFPIAVGELEQAQPGDVVVITATPDAGYVITPALDLTKWTHTFAVPGACLVLSEFEQPQPTSQSCVVTGDDGSLDGGSATVPTATTPAEVTHTLVDAFITIPSDTPHAIYYIDDVQKDPGKYILPPGTYKVSAVPATGYEFQNYTGPWTEVLTSAEPCGDLITHPLVEPAAVQVQLGCLTQGSYTLSNDLSDSKALTWTVNGSTVSEGTYKVTTASTVKVHVVANGPDYGLEPDATTDWTFHFVRPTACELPTLALTGSSPTGWIALGYALLVSGLALLALRFTRRRPEQA